MNNPAILQKKVNINLVNQWIRDLASLIWGYPMLIFLTLIGLYFSFRLKGLQFSRFFKAARLTYLYEFKKSNVNMLTDNRSATNKEIGSAILRGIPYKIYKS
jgi:Na+/alanine symporter